MLGFKTQTTLEEGIRQTWKALTEKK